LKGFCSKSRMMNDKKKWDEVYRIHLEDAPWMSQAFSDILIKELDVILPDDVSGVRILDYACGNGKVARHYSDKGAIVDMADISELLVNWLKKEYEGCRMGIYNVSSPLFLPVDYKYDVVLACNFFHHVSPEMWLDYLDAFDFILNRGGTFIITGWDDDDPIIRDTGIAPYTSHRVWSISPLTRYFDRDVFSIENEKTIAVSLKKFPTFDRVVRIYKIKKK